MAPTSRILASSLAFCMAAMLHAPVHASMEPAIIESVQMPAWIERGGVRHPAVLGAVLRQSDRLITGVNARLLLRLVEGSRVKLGENAQLNLNGFEVSRGDSGISFRSALNVVRGAFRFTTDSFFKVRNSRRVDIQYASLTVGIRGTDVWGKQGEDKEIVCLIEGKVDVERAGDDKVAGSTTLDKPLQFYIAPKDQPSLPVATVSGEQLTKWAAETDMAAGAGVQMVDGKWQVKFYSSDNLYAAFDMRDAIRKQGYPVEILPGREAGKRVYYVHLASLASEEDAQTVASRVGPAMSLSPKVGLTAVSK